MLTLHFAIDQDNRAVLKSTEDMNITTETKGVKNWVQGRQYEDSMRQAMVYVTHEEDGTPFDLTDVNPWFEGVLPDGVHRILDAKHGVLIDPVGGQFRFDFPKQAFAVFGSYKQAFFRLEREGSSISTLEIAFSVLSDTVISGLIPSDYITPFEDLYAKLEDILANADGDLKSKLAEWTTKFTDLMTSLSKQGTDTSNMLANVQTTLKNLELQISSDGILHQADLDSGLKSITNLIGDLTALKSTGASITEKVEHEFEYRGINVEWYGAKGDGVTDDTAAIQQAIDKNPNQTILLRPGKTYNISKPLVFDKSQHFDGRTATIFLTEDADYAIKLMIANSIVENFTLSKDKTTNASGILSMYNNNLIQNVVSKNCIWKVFLHCVDMKEGHLKQIRVDNDTANKTGSIFQFDHCLNNTMSDIFSGYADKGVYLSSISSETDASVGYENEGLTMTNVILVNNNIAIDVEKCTFLTITSCLFDFCQNWGVRYNEGFSLSVTGCWIQVMQSEAVAIGAANETTAFGLISIQGNTITGQSTNTSQAAVNINLAATSATITGNTLLQIKGGAVRTKNSQISGNVIENGIGFYGYDEIQNIQTFYPTSTAPNFFTVPNAQIEFTATELGTLNYLHAIGSTGSDGVPHLTAVANNGIAIASVSNSGSVTVINDSKDYSKMELVCKIYPFDHRQNSNIALT